MREEEFAPCPCRLSREAAMSCPRESRGRLIWTPVSETNGQPIGPAEMEPIGEEGLGQWPLRFGDGWEHWSEGVARDHARIRHLEFVIA